MTTIEGSMSQRLGRLLSPPATSPSVVAAAWRRLTSVSTDCIPSDAISFVVAYALLVFEREKSAVVQQERKMGGKKRCLASRVAKSFFVCFGGLLLPLFFRYVSLEKNFRARTKIFSLFFSFEKGEKNFSTFFPLHPKTLFLLSPPFLPAFFCEKNTRDSSRERPRCVYCPGSVAEEKAHTHARKRDKREEKRKDFDFFSSLAAPTPPVVHSEKRKKMKSIGIALCLPSRSLPLLLSVSLAHSRP